jgi:hypothetical protein
LSIDDLQKFISLETQPGTPEHEARLLWLFSFYCQGMNFRDISYLKYKDIQPSFIEYGHIGTLTLKQLKYILISSIKGCKFDNASNGFNQPHFTKKLNTMKTLFLSPFVLFFVVSCSPNPLTTLEPEGEEQFQNIKIEKGDLKAVFVDNSEMPPNHRAGYNGIAELYHVDQDSSIFVPLFAGFNLEHIFNGDSLEQFFEPRINPMILYKKSETEVLLYQKKTPYSSAESLTEFTVVAPYYIDITFRCIFHDKAYFRHGYAGFFWASYINKPPDRNIYFRGIDEGQPDEKWISAFSGTHGIKSTHKGINDQHDFFFASGFNIQLAKNFSNYRYTRPFYFGRFHNMALAFFFESSEIIRLTQSPTGGGQTNPAWDFQYLIPDPKTGKEYSFQARMVYKPFVDNEDITQEFEIWTKNN